MENKGTRGKRSPFSLRYNSVRLSPVRAEYRDLLEAIVLLKGGSKSGHLEKAIKDYAIKQGVIDD